MQRPVKRKHFDRALNKAVPQIIRSFIADLKEFDDTLVVIAKTFLSEINDLNRYQTVERLIDHLKTCQESMMKGIKNMKKSIPFLRPKEYKALVKLFKKSRTLPTSVPNLEQAIEDILDSNEALTPRIKRVIGLFIAIDQLRS